MSVRETTVIAVDWSGRRDDAGGTWLARAEGGSVVDLRQVTRAGAIDEVVRHSRLDRDLVVGLDFAFSFPQWVLDLRGSPPAIWGVVAAEGERWLAECPPPFCGRKGTKAPAAERFRRTERALMARGLRPTSVFQVAGRGAVGTGSLRGMPHLLTLLAAGFTVWPFTGAVTEGPVVLELWPRLFTGPVVKSDPAARAAFLTPLVDGLGPFAGVAAAVEDAFDAAVAALGMAAHVDELRRLPAVDDPEGEVYVPASLATTGAKASTSPSWMTQ